MNKTIFGINHGNCVSCYRSTGISVLANRTHRLAQDGRLNQFTANDVLYPGPIELSVALHAIPGRVLVSNLLSCQPPVFI